MNNNFQETQNLQRLASNPNNSSWVFASAGSGKTKILTDRVLRLLLDNVPANKILCLTFTKTGANEMQERINSRLLEWILFSDDKLEKELENLSGKKPTPSQKEKAKSLLIKILDDEFKIKIQTIHSFCQNLIKIFPFEIGIKPNFEIIESNKEKLLLLESQDNIFKKAQNDEFLANILKEIHQKLHDQEISKLVSNLLNKKEKLLFLKENFGNIENIIDKIFETFSIEKNSSLDGLFQNFAKTLNQNKLSTLNTELARTGLKTNAKHSQAISNFQNNLKLDNFNDFKLVFFTQKNEPRKISKKLAENEQIIQIIDEQISLILNFEESLNSLKIVNNSALLLYFIDAILSEYSQIKKQNSFLDYNDLITQTNRLLANPDFSDWVKMKMDGNFDHILIDESQDTNHAQWNIIKALSEDFFSGMSASQNLRSIFIVGDEKQSIYSFQGANPYISSEIFQYFKEKSSDQLKKIELNSSFRSVSTILNAVDQVFSDEDRKNSISKISKFQSHKAIRDGAGIVEIWPQIQNPKEEKNNDFEWKFKFKDEEKTKESEILAHIIALKIKERVTSQDKIKSTDKEVYYGDFMILLRNYTNGFDRFLTKYFNKYQIPFSSVSKIKFSESLLIQDLVALIKFTLFKFDDLNLACLLKSPLFKVRDEELLQICLKKEEKEQSIYRILEEDFPQIKSKLDEFCALAKKLNIFEFLHQIIYGQSYQTNFIEDFGQEAIEILDKFLLFTSDFVNNFSANSQKFLEFINKIDPEISLSSNEDNLVKVTTIHSAKGLQAPIVIIPDCAYNFSQLLSTKEEISWLNIENSQIPIWCSKKNEENQIVKNHKQEKLQMAKDEYLRLLYVAMTRAEDELYIGGFGASKDAQSWYEIIKNSLPENLINEEDFANEFEKLQKKFSKKAEAITQEETPKITKNKDYEFRNIQKIEEVSSQITKAQIKGKLIHKILEIFGLNHQENKDWLNNITNKLIENTNLLASKDKEEIKSLSKNFLFSDKFDEIFSENIKCEIAISSPDKKSYRIDLLQEKTDEVVIIDYKSDETIPKEIPEKYLRQLQNYQKLAKAIYKDKKISLAILWTSKLELTKIA